MPGHSSTVIPFALNLLTNTDWANLSDNISGAFFPDFFIVYFGQDFPQGGISSNDIKVKFAKLGTGYNLLVSATAEAIDKRNDILEVLGAASEQTNYSRRDFLKSHFCPSYNPAKSLLIASGPHGFISIVNSDLYPVEADKLRKIFIPALTSPLPATALSTLNTLTLQLPSNVEKEAEAKKGITKSSFPHLWQAQRCFHLFWRSVLSQVSPTHSRNWFSDLHSKRARPDEYQVTLDFNRVHQESYSPSPIAGESSNRRGHLALQQS